MLRSIRQRSWFVWLGLFALTGQIVLTLGHMHAGRENDLRDALAGLFEPHAQIEHHPTAVAAHERDAPMAPGHLGEWCAYCWTIAQAAFTILPAPAPIRHGHLDQFFRLQFPTAQFRSRDQTSPFDSRGPPLTSPV
ncbi:MAG: hypothetical protein R3D30_15770 [Hyphomicrobiales bacterium]